MLIKTWRLITIMFVSLSMSMAFCHLLQLPPRMSYDAELWRATQSMFRLFGPPVGAIIEIGALVLAAILTFLVRQRRPAFRWTLACAVCLFAAQAAWWLLINPANNEMVHWTMNSIPADWTRYREQWEYTHAARAILQIAALGALAISLIRETPAESPREHKAISVEQARLAS
jgi:hypothetical protein